MIQFEDLEKVDRGVYAGSEQLLPEGPWFHVELIEVKRDTVAVNSLYQQRIDDWLNRNDDCMPQLHRWNGRLYFCNVEVFAE